MVASACVRRWCCHCLKYRHLIFLAVMSCHWSKHGHVIQIFCDIVIRKKCILWCIDRTVNTQFLWRCIRCFNAFAAGATVALAEKLNVSNQSQWISRKIIGLVQFKLIRMYILNIYILQIIIKMWLNSKWINHERFVKHLNAIKCRIWLYFVRYYKPSEEYLAEHPW